MQQQFVLEGRYLREVAAGGANIAVLTAPTAEERRFLTEFFGVDQHDLMSALDPEEIAASSTTARPRPRPSSGSALRGRRDYSPPPLPTVSTLRLFS
jgi:hypothetical protein